MGKNVRIEELEREVAYLRKRSEIAKEAMEYVRDLTELPEDATLYYYLSPGGKQAVFHEIGKSARVLWARIEASHRDFWASS